MKMNKVIIDKSFFNLNSPLSKGLISGLNKLSQKNFEFEVPSFSKSENEILTKILDLEGIEINKKSKNSFNKTFSLTTKEGLGENVISASKNSRNKNFKDAVNEILTKLRAVSYGRKTKETDISISLSLDGNGETEIKTGVGFFDHMLEQIAKHANINLNINVNGDLHVDEHHTVEDVGIALGSALSEALGDKKGIKRYGFFLPMDETIARCAVDLSGRTYLNFKCKFSREKVGDFPTELTEEFFRGLSSGLKANIFLRAKGKNDHHKIEAMFKAFAKSFNDACRFEDRNEGKLPSTKGIL